MKYSCVIFDCDGVLVDSESISNRVLLDMVHSLGVDVGQEEIHRFAGKALKELFAHFEVLSGKQLPEDFEQQFRANSFEAFRNDLRPIAGVRELLEGLDVPFCVASSGPIEKMDVTLTAADLMPLLKGRIYSAYQIGKWKPDPAIFLHAASKMGFDPKECAVIEDSVAGVQAGVAGGFDVYGFAAEASKQASQLQENGAIVFSEMKALPDLMK